MMKSLVIIRQCQVSDLTKLVPILMCLSGSMSM